MASLCAVVALRAGPSWALEKAPLALARLAAVAQLRAPGLDVVDAGREGRLRGQKEAQPSGLLDGTHAPQELRGLPVGPALRGIRGSVDRFLPEGGIDVPGRAGAHAHAERGHVHT